MWCDGDSEKCVDKSGRERSSDEDKICSSVKFWTGKQCRNDNYYRCRGERPGECIWKGRGSGSVCDGEIGGDGCQDKSDEVCPANVKCSTGKILTPD